MHLALVGLNHRTAPVGLRERLSVARGDLPDALTNLMAREAISEGLILSTCNRTEIYACTAGRAHDSEITQFMSEFCGVPASEFMPYVYTSSGHKAAEHLFRVTSGIDSMVLGETQILGQIKDAYAAACGHRSVGVVLNTLFQQAAAVGKRAHTETSIGRGAFSVGSAVVQLARSIFEDLNDRTILVIGAGKMARNAIVHLASAGTSNVVVANRSYDRAVELASEFGGRAIRLDEVATALETVDIVITSTGMQGFTISYDAARSAARRRRGKPMFLIDIAVPRDVDERAGKLENVYLYNIDDLEAVVTADNASRSAEVARVETIIADELRQFTRWLRTQDAVPVITAMHEKLERIRRAEVESLRRKLPHLSRQDMEAIDIATRSIVNKICHQPMLQIKDYANTESTGKLEVVCEAFGLDAGGIEDRCSSEAHPRKRPSDMTTERTTGRVKAEA